MKTLKIVQFYLKVLKASQGIIHPAKMVVVGPKPKPLKYSHLN